MAAMAGMALGVLKEACCRVLGSKVFRRLAREALEVLKRELKEVAVRMIEGVMGTALELILRAL
jgi:hypothetical protein